MWNLWGAVGGGTVSCSGGSAESRRGAFRRARVVGAFRRYTDPAKRAPIKTKLVHSRLGKGAAWPWRRTSGRRKRATGLRPPSRRVTACALAPPNPLISRRDEKQREHEKKKKKYALPLKDRAAATPADGGRGVATVLRSRWEIRSQSSYYSCADSRRARQCISRNAPLRAAPGPE